MMSRQFCTVNLFQERGVGANNNVQIYQANPDNKSILGWQSCFFCVWDTFQIANESNVSFHLRQNQIIPLTYNLPFGGCRNPHFYEREPY